MEPDFWHDRWQQGQIGFHQDQINDYLVRNWERVQAPAGSRVLVPLAGKSLDMLWLRDQGHQVMGVEVSPLAVDAFFEENGIAAVEEQDGPFRRKRGDGVELWCGDFFDLTPEHTQDLGGVYDRASLIALPPSMRERYARHLAELLPTGTRVLLITFEYPQAEMDGPPFSVSEEEVNDLYRDTFTVECLERFDALAANARFQERGLTSLYEKNFLLTRL